MSTDPASPRIPEVALDLADYTHPRYADEWRYGPDRGMWQGGYPVEAAKPDPSQPDGVVVGIGHFDLTRAELPEFVAWLTAVYEATDPNRADDETGEDG